MTDMADRELLELSKAQLDILRHMLGINEFRERKPKPYRDYAAVYPGDPMFVELARMGAVERYRTAGPGFPYDYYRCTDTGRAAAIASYQSLVPKKSKRIYLRFLSLSDCCPDMTFKQFLTDPNFADIRREV